MLCKILQQYSQYSFFDGILKTSRVTPLSRSRLKLPPYSAGQMSVIIVHKLMKIAGYLVMVVLIRGYWKNLISDGQFSSSCRLKMKKNTMTLSCASTLLLHYQRID